MNFQKPLMLLALIFTGLAASGCGPGTETDQPQASEKVTPPVEEQTAVLSDEQVTDIVRRSYQYVAMYNVNNKTAEKQGGWGTCVADSQLKDHTMREIARPNNDTLYTACMLDLRSDAFVLNIPAFDSDYASLMNTGYDHYVNMPLVSRLGHYEEPGTMLIFSARTANYDGAPIDGIDHYFEATGDFISAVFRVMPHFADQERFRRIVDQNQTVKAVTLAEFQGGQPTPPLPVTITRPRLTSRSNTVMAAITPQAYMPSMTWANTCSVPARCSANATLASLPDWMISPLSSASTGLVWLIRNRGTTRPSKENHSTSVSRGPISTR